MSKYNTDNSYAAKINVTQLKKYILNSNQELDLHLSVPGQQSIVPDDSLFRKDNPRNVKQCHNNHLNHQKSTQKQLNLKQYLHLSSIERKNKSKSRKGSRSVSQNYSLATKESLQLDNAERQPKEGQIELNKVQSNVKLLKEETLKQIEEEIKKLRNLQTYILKQEKLGEEVEDQMFWLNMSSSIEKSSVIHSQMGLQISERQKDRIPKGKESYFWCRSEKKLQSPAKVKKGHEAAFLSLALISSQEIN